MCVCWADGGLEEGENREDRQSGGRTDADWRRYQRLVFLADETAVADVIGVAVRKNREGGYDARCIHAGL